MVNECTHDQCGSIQATDNLISRLHHHLPFCAEKVEKGQGTRLGYRLHLPELFTTCMIGRRCHCLTNFTSAEWCSLNLSVHALHNIHVYIVPTSSYPSQ